MNKEKFLELYKSISKFLDIGDDLIESPILNTDLMLDFQGFGWDAISNSLSFVFDDEGIDWLYWWFFERPYLKNEQKAFDKSGVVIPTNTPEDLWNIIEICIKKNA